MYKHIHIHVHVCAILLNVYARLNIFTEMCTCIHYTFIHACLFTEEGGINLTFLNFATLFCQNILEQEINGSNIWERLTQYMLKLGISNVICATGTAHAYVGWRQFISVEVVKYKVLVIEGTNKKKCKGV